MKLRDLLAVPFLLIGWVFLMIGIWIGTKWTAETLLKNSSLIYQGKEYEINKTKLR